jgi:hypothetical protein
MADGNHNIDINRIEQVWDQESEKVLKHQANSSYSLAGGKPLFA